MKKKLLYLFLSFFFVLLLLSLLGDLTSLGRYPSVPVRTWEQFDSNLIASTPNRKALYRYAESRLQAAGGASDAEKVHILYDVVAARFGHSETANYTPFSNWLIWTLGQLAAPVGMTHDIIAVRDVDALLKYGDNGLCSQVSYVLVDLALHFGYPARHVGLNGHVTMEIFYGGKWRLYDPDYEVVATDENGEVLGVSDFEKSGDLVRQWFLPRGAGADTVDFFTTPEDNSFPSYPPGSRFNWKVQFMTFIEKAGNLLKYPIPTAGLIVCLILLIRIKPHGTPTRLTLS
ncbi:MAG: hypothetical protein GC154_07165 [bacterium]|nr:hypothetical protein [bacterium]